MTEWKGNEVRTFRQTSFGQSTTRLMWLVSSFPTGPLGVAAWSFKSSENGNRVVSAKRSRPGMAGQLRFRLAIPWLCAFGTLMVSAPGGLVGASTALAVREHSFCESCSFGSKGSGDGQFKAPSGVAASFAAAPETPRTEAATAITNTTAELHGLVQPNETSETTPKQMVSWFLQYNRGPTCAGVGSRTSIKRPEGGGFREAPAEPSQETISGLQPGVGYTFCLVVDNEEGEEAKGNEVSFTTTTVKPIVGAASASGVTSSEATVEAQVNAEGAPTDYFLEYGTTEAYGSHTSRFSLGAPAGAVAVHVQLRELQPDTVYYFRFVAVNAFGTASGPAGKLMTTGSLGPSVLTLPDGRAIELVSSPTSNQDVYVPSEEGAANGPAEGFRSDNAPVRAAAKGDAMAYVAEPPGGGEAGGTGHVGNALGDEWLADRTLGGWVTKDIQPPGSSAGTGYEAFSTDLSIGFLYSPNPGNILTSDAPPGCGLYSRDNPTGQLHTFVTGVQSGAHCGNHFSIFAGDYAGGSHRLFEDEGALTTNAVANAPAEYSLYDSSAGETHLINVLPDGQSTADATLGGAPLFAKSFSLSNTREPELPDFSNVMSADGSRVFWTALEAVKNQQGQTMERAKGLYVRVNDTQPQSPIENGVCTVASDACTVQVDAGEAKCVAEGKCTGGGGRFWTATPDGSKVFFTDCRKLTADSTAVFNESTGCAREGVAETSEALLIGQDLYEYNVSERRLTDLTVDKNPGDPLHADVQGVVAVNETGAPGSYVYFVAAGALASGSTPRTCSEAKEESQGGTPTEQSERREEEQGHLPHGRGCNLYVLHSGEPIKLIAVLSPRDDNLRGLNHEGSIFMGDWRAALNMRMAEATPDGRSLVFRSIQPLTGYDNRPPEGPAAPEVFLYQAEPGGPGVTVCASCDPTGAPPSEPGSEPIGGYLPPTGTLGYTYMRRWLSEDGTRVFFDTKEALVPQDTDHQQALEEQTGKPEFPPSGGQDVYEWEREGAPSCPAKAPPRRNGAATSCFRAEPVPAPRTSSTRAQTATMCSSRAAPRCSRKRQTGT